MPNPIKYTTGSETLALKKGNFYIGTGAVGKGPSDTTGYYQGPSVPSNGYVIYMNKVGAPGGLSYHSVANDSELISFTNSLAGQSYTGVNQCFDYYYGQNDKVLVNQDYPADYPYIVMDGLVLNLDAGITQSYSGSGTVWTDVNGLGPKNNGTLINGPTFNSANGGSIVFDGVDDYCVVSSNSNSSLFGDFSIIQWYRPTTNDGGYRILFETNKYRSNLFGEVGIAVYQYSNYFRIWRRNAVNAYTELIRTSSNTVGLNIWKTFTLVRNNGVFTFYIDTIPSGTYSTDTNDYSDTSYHIGGDGPPTSSYWFKGNVSQTQIYNRALSAQEILQNYNATKGRFGL